MKKAFALVLALVMVLSMGTIAFAEDNLLASFDVANGKGAVEDAVADIVDFSEGLNLGADIFATIEKAAVSALESVSGLDFTKFNSDSIANIIDGFRSVLADIGIDTSSSTLKELFNNLKQKIKDLYCGAEAEIPEMDEEAPETGSSATGIAAFAAVSVAAAAAYVCTKKKVA